MVCNSIDIKHSKKKMWCISQILGTSSLRIFFNKQLYVCHVCQQSYVLTLCSRKQGFTLSFCLSQLSCPQQNLSEVFLGHFSVWRINILSLKTRTENREWWSTYHYEKEIPKVGRAEQTNQNKAQIDVIKMTEHFQPNGAKTVEMR